MSIFNRTAAARHERDHNSEAPTAIRTDATHALGGGGTQVMDQAALESDSDIDAIIAAFAADPNADTDFGLEALGEAAALNADSVTTVDETASVPQRRPIFRGAAYQLLSCGDYNRQLQQSVTELHQALDQSVLIEAFTEVARTHNLSAPVVSAFRATPGFTQAATTFPEASRFNIVPETKQSPNQQLGLESLADAHEATADIITTHGNAVAAAFVALLDTLEPMLPLLKSQLAADKIALESSDLTDEVMAILPVQTIAIESFLTLFTALESNLAVVDLLNVDQLRANPETLAQEAISLTELSGDIGPVLGFKTDGTRLIERTKEAAYIATRGNFGDKAITKADLVLLLNKGEQILDMVAAVTEAKDSIGAAVLQSVSDAPTATQGSDVVYGRNDHMAVVGTYASLNAKLLQESVAAVTMLLATSDAALDVDDGLGS